MPKLLVGVGKQDIAPVLVETEWQDLNGNKQWEANEPFTDTNNNGKFDAVWMAGFGSGRPATKIHDAPEVRAIALSVDGKTVVICVLDVIGYFIDEIDRIKMDPIVSALAIDHLIVSSTHSHEGADTVGLWGPDPMVSGLNPDYQKLTRDKAALAIQEAVNGLKPAKMRIAQAQTVDNPNEPDPLKKTTKTFLFDNRDPIIYDPTLTIAQFSDEADPSKTIATLVNWASHPEYSGSENNEITADYVHWLRTTIEDGVAAQGISGIGGTTVFVQGPLGGQIGPGGVAPLDANGMPVNMDGLPKAEAVGTNVAKLALEALKNNGEDAASHELVFRTKDLVAKVENIGYHFAFLLQLIDRQLYNFDPSMPIQDMNIPDLKTRVSYVQVGPLAMMTNPGELHPELWVGGYDGSWSWGQTTFDGTLPNKPDPAMAPKAPYLRDIMLTNPGVKYVFSAGLAEDFIGYIVPAFNYVLDAQNPYLAEASGEHYEETNSIGPLVEQQIQHPMMELAQPPAP